MLGNRHQKFFVQKCLCIGVFLGWYNWFHHTLKEVQDPKIIKNHLFKTYQCKKKYVYIYIYIYIYVSCSCIGIGYYKWHIYLWTACVILHENECQVLKSKICEFRKMTEKTPYHLDGYSKTYSNTFVHTWKLWTSSLKIANYRPSLAKQEWRDETENQEPR